MSEVFYLNFGEQIKHPDLIDHFIKIQKDENNEIDFSFVSIIDGIEEEKTLSYFMEYGNHRVSVDNVKLFMDVLLADFQSVCKKAEESNRTVIGFKGIIKGERTWLVRCNSCNTEKESYMRFFNQCMGCKTISQTKSFEQFLSDSKKMHGDKYIYSCDDYKNSRSKVKIFCTKCNKYFYQLGINHSSGHGCPSCKEPRGEIAISLYLDKINIKYEKYKKFDGLIYKNGLNFDFYLSDLNLLIEYDGEHHFEVVDYSKDPDTNMNKFELTKLRDKIKNDWASENNIPLLRIPYWDYNRITELIDEFILMYSKREVKQLTLDI